MSGIMFIGVPLNGIRFLLNTVATILRAVYPKTVLFYKSCFSCFVFPGCIISFPDFPTSSCCFFGKEGHCAFIPDFFRPRVKNPGLGNISLFPPFFPHF